MLDAKNESREIFFPLAVQPGRRLVEQQHGRLKRQIADDQVLPPRVITQSTVLVAHPELVAQRLCRFADIVGRERVIASADCGFASFAGSNEVHPSIVWAKFKSLIDGSRIASKQLWRQ